jgi:hypothetical protein
LWGRACGAGLPDTCISSDIHAHTLTAPKCETRHSREWTGGMISGAKNYHIEKDIFFEN